MKMYLVILAVILFTGCAVNKPKPKTKPKSFSQLMDICISKYLDKGVSSKGAIEICETILKRKN